MNFFRTLTLLFMLACLLTAQTMDLGQNVFFNEEGVINIAADASVASRTLEGDYVMFVLYLIADEGQYASIDRKDVMLFHNENVYAMPSLKELRANYHQDRRDNNLYNRLGKDSLIQSKMRFFRFQWDYDFFPVIGQNVTLTDRGDMSSQLGFKTKVYFKNQGFASGDSVVIKVTDRKNPDVWGAVTVIL